VTPATEGAPAVGQPLAASDRRGDASITPLERDQHTAMNFRNDATQAAVLTSFAGHNSNAPHQTVIVRCAGDTAEIAVLAAERELDCIEAWLHNLGWTEIPLDRVHRPRPSFAPP